jgi:stage V sporulation protein AC
MGKMAKEEKKIFKDFETISKQTVPKPKYFKNILLAFIVGGAICTIGQFILNMLIKFGIDEETAKLWLPIIMIFIGALLTGVGVYDKIASFAGAGTVVPITGFSNAVVSPAIEFKKEGFVFGVAAKMFTIAGPVLVYGIGTSVLIGLVYYILGIIGIIK